MNITEIIAHITEFLGVSSEALLGSLGVLGAVGALMLILTSK